MTDTVDKTGVSWQGHKVSIEYQWICSDQQAAPLLVFLHEGLGSLASWKDFPRALCRQVGCRGLVYSRPGYGASTPRASDERWGVDFMHLQAYELLPELLRVLEVKMPIWILGHSDGASIALLFAARYRRQVSGLILLAPHIMVEAMSILGIERARSIYLDGDLRDRLARYHDNPDSAFWGWNDIWLDPDFRNWSIENEIGNIQSPLLAIQGEDDEYGSMAQIDRIAIALTQTELLKLADCGHVPQRDQCQAVVRAVTDFMQRHDPYAENSATKLLASAGTQTSTRSAKNNVN